MKTSRPIPGILLLAFTFFYAFASSCGLVGHWVHRASVLLIGPAGSVVMAITLGAVGALLVFPIGVWVSAVRWAFRGRAVKHTTARRSVKPIEVEVTVAPVPKLPTVERMKLSDVRTALKNLGYERGEYEPVVAGMDPALPLETLVRGALKELRRN